MTKNRKKMMSLIFAMIFFIAAITACGGSGTSSNPIHIPSGTPTSSPTKEEKPTHTPTPTEKPGNGYIDNWFLFGDLSFQSITIDKKGAWEMRNPIDTDGSGGYIYCEGYSVMDDFDNLVMYEKAGEEVGFASLAEEELTLVLTTDFEWTFADYLSGDLVFDRESTSMSFESQ